MDLKCKNLNCKYNNKFACMAKDIEVSDKLICKNYTKTNNLPPEQKQNVPKTMFQIVPKYHPYRHSLSIDINCNAKCLFNCSGKCVSNGITIANDQKNAKCYTFAKK